MTRTRIIGATLAAAALAASIVAVTSADTITGKIKLTAVATEITREGAFPGAMEVQYWKLHTASRPTKPFGYLALSCAYISLGSSLRQCVGTLSLPLGKLAVNGTLVNVSVFELAVVGGTGVYVGASGVMDANRVGRDGYAITINL